MTHDEMIAVIRGHKEGKQIQFRKFPHDDWYDCGCNRPIWDFSSADYRTKPEPPSPREWMIALDKDGEARCTVKLPIKLSSATDCEIVHVREVIEP